ncbi:Charged multivesicular body protein 2b [Blomia tropicalis]|nr:Charged multivesicular body protein 2b [Blomia tropicalis]
MFGKKETPNEAARRQQREITRAQRTVQRSSAELEREEKKLEAEIKKLAKAGQIKSCQMLAKQLVALRQQKTRTMAANYRIGAVGSQAKMLSANNVVASAMGASANVMKATNDQMKPEQIAAILNSFDQENMKMDMKDEMIADSLDEMLGGSDEEAESDAIVNQVLDEIGIDINQKAICSLSKVHAPSSDPLSDADLEALISNAGSSGSRLKSKTTN